MGRLYEVFEHLRSANILLKPKKGRKFAKTSELIMEAQALIWNHRKDRPVSASQKIQQLSLF